MNTLDKWILIASSFACIYLECDECKKLFGINECTSYWDYNEEEMTEFISKINELLKKKQIECVAQGRALTLSDEDWISVFEQAGDKQ